MLRAVKMWINCTVREEKVQIWILETTSLGSLRFCLCLSEPLLLRQLSQIGTWNLCRLHIMNDILRYDFYLYWTVVWQSSVMDVLVFSHRSVADVSWESISNMGCVVQACSNGITRIRGAWSCRQVTHTHTHPSHCWWPQRNNSTLGVAEKAYSRERNSHWRNVVHLPEACGEAHRSHCVFISSEMRILLCYRWYVSVFRLVCPHSYCDRCMITFQAFKVCVFV